MTCAAYVREATATKGITDSWIGGYLTALNEFGPDRSGTLALNKDPAFYSALAERKCKHNHDRTLDWVVYQIYEDLITDKRG
jgi:hypothetical protein